MVAITGPFETLQNRIVSDTSSSETGTDGTKSDPKAHGKAKAVEPALITSGNRTSRCAALFDITPPISKPLREPRPKAIPRYVPTADKLSPCIRAKNVGHHWLNP